MLLPNETLCESDKVFIPKDANNRAYYGFGKRNDGKLLSLIPEAEDLSMWSSICVDCRNQACFEEAGRILCRYCRNNRRNFLKENIITPKSKPKRSDREEDENTNGQALKRMNESCKNLSLNESEDEKEARMNPLEESKILTETPKRNNNC